MSSRVSAGPTSPVVPFAVPEPTEERILVAAEQCMARLGVSRLSMTDVATQAGVSRGAVYLHFADRDTLIDAVLTRTAERFVAGSAEVVRRRRTLVAQVAEAAVFIRSHLGDSMLTLRLPADEESLFATLLTSRLERMVEEWVDFWLPFLDEAEERGEVRADVDHRQAAEWIVRMMLSFAIMPAVSFDADRPEHVRAFVRAFIVDGFGPRLPRRGMTP
jgi:AcrR family transcriptional regulator